MRRTHWESEKEWVAGPFLGNLMLSAWRSWPAPNKYNLILRQFSIDCPVQSTQSHTYFGVLSTNDCVQPIRFSLSTATRRSHAKHCAIPPFPPPLDRLTAYRAYWSAKRSPQSISYITEDDFGGWKLYTATCRRSHAYLLITTHQRRHDTILIGTLAYSYFLTLRPMNV